jgi:hypothetical protein
MRPLIAALLLAAWGSLGAQGVEEPGEPGLGAGPFGSSQGDADNAYDAPVAGFIGPDGIGKARLQSGVDIDGNPVYSNPNNYVNPIFKAWASEIVNYSPTPGVASNWKTPGKALGAVTGDNFDIVTLGELFSTSSAPPTGTLPPFVPVGDPSRVPYSGNPADPNDGFGFIGYDAPGSITVGFSTAITNGAGADFAVFENGFTSNHTTPDGSVAGEVFAELAYVEVSTDGVNFARLPSVSLTDAAVGQYGTIDPTNVFNLAGKSGNAYGESWGTAFDLSTLVDPTAILNAMAAAEITLSGEQLASLQLAIDANLAVVELGLLNLDQINYVRLIDIPGNGTFTDSLGNPIYDAWYTFGSGGFDLEAIGAINVVPEPSSAALVATAVAMLMMRRARRMQT